MPVIVIDKVEAVRRDPLDRASQLFRQPEIVGVEEGNKTPAGGIDSQVPRCRGASVVRGVEKAKSRVLMGGGLNERDGIIGRAVVDQDLLPAGQGLRSHRRQGFG